MTLSRTNVQLAFQNALGRSASQQDEDAFFAASQSGQQSDIQLYTAISNSQEANLNTDPVVRFYQAAFGRVPDQGGLDNATDYVRQFGATAQTYQALSDMLVQSPEFQARYGTGSTVDAGYVQALYVNILGREGSSAEINAYVSGANGYDTRGEVLYAVSQSQEAIGRTDAAVNSFLLNAAEGDAVYTGPLFPDAVAPRVAISLENASLQAGQTTKVTFDFTETVTGFDLTDVQATGGALSGLMQSTTDATIYTATYTAGQGGGTGQIAVTGAYTDVAGNTGMGGTSAPVTVAPPAGTGGGNPQPTPPVFSIAAVDANKSEGNSGTTAFTFTVSRTGSTDAAATLNYAVTGDIESGSNAADFGGTLPSGQVSFVSGASTATLTINVSGDTAVERNETFAVALSNPPTNGTVSLEQGSATGVIRNDDAPVILPPAGTTYTLTNNADTDPGTASDDTINGTVGEDGTFTTADRIDGAGGTDRFNITVTGDGVKGSIAIPLTATNPDTRVDTPTVANVEIFNIRNTSSQTVTFDASAIIGEQQVWNDQSTGGAVSVTGLVTGATIGVRGSSNPFVSDSTNTSFTYASSTDPVIIAVDGGVGTNFFFVDGPEISRAQTGEAAVTINSTGAANVLSVIDLDNGTDGTIKAVTINATVGLTAQLSADDYAMGAGLTLNGEGVIDLHRAALSGNITTIDARLSSGGVDIRADNQADLAFSGGAGNDTLRLGDTLTTADAIDGGAGIGIDTVEIVGGTYTDSTNAVVSGIRGLINVEQLRFTTATTIDSSLVQEGITKLIFADGGDEVVTNTGARTYAFNNDSGNATFTASQGQKTLNLEFISGNTRSSEGLVTADGHTAVNIVTTAEPSPFAFLPNTYSVPDTIVELKVNSGAAINISGANAFEIDSLTSTAGRLLSADTGFFVNATQLNGRLILGASNAADTIVVGSGGSIVRGGTGSDIITLGNGADQALYFAGGGESGVVTGSGDTRSINDIDAITGFTASGSSADKLGAYNTNNIIGGSSAESGASNTYTALSANEQASVGTAGSLTASIDAAAGAHTASGWTAFTYDNNTYALHESVANASGQAFGSGDSVVKLAGVNVSELTGANFGLTANQPYPGGFQFLD